MWNYHYWSTGRPSCSNHFEYSKLVFYLLCLFRSLQVLSYPFFGSRLLLLLVGLFPKSYSHRPLNYQNNNKKGYLICFLCLGRVDFNFTEKKRCVRFSVRTLEQNVMFASFLSCSGQTSDFFPRISSRFSVSRKMLQPVVFIL